MKSEFKTFVSSKRFGLILKVNWNKFFLLKFPQHHLFVCLSKTNLITSVKHLKGLKLAESGSANETDILISSNFYWSLVTGKIKAGKKNEPVAVLVGF